VEYLDGTLKVLDGNTTLHVLQGRGEEDVEVEVVRPLQPTKKVKSVEDLLTHAKEALPEYDSLIDEMAESSGAAQISSRKGDGLKDRESIERKVKDDYDGDHHMVVDVLGKTLIFDDEQSLREGLASVIDNPQVMGWKDRWSDPLPSGYQDVNVSVRLSNGHVAELQLMTRDMYQAKSKQFHSIYKVLRKLEAEKGVAQVVKNKVKEGLGTLMKAGYARASKDAKKPAASRTTHDQESSSALFRSIREDSLYIFQILASEEISQSFSPSMRKVLSESISKTKMALSPSRKTGSLSEDSEASGGRFGMGSSVEEAGGVDPSSKENIPPRGGEFKEGKPGGEMTVTRSISIASITPFLGANLEYQEIWYFS
jgi:hypothetical protein